MGRRLKMRRCTVATFTAILVMSIFAIASAQVVLDYAVVGFETVLPFHSELIDAFNASQSAIHVNIRNYAGDSENVMLEKLAVELATGTGPDILYFNDKALPAFAAAGAFADITSFINRDLSKEIDDFFPTSVNAYKIGTEIYGLPGVLHTLTIYYNQDLLDQAGVRYSPNWTLDDFTTVARRTTRINAEGITTQWGLNGFNWWPAFLPFLWMHEGDFFTPVMPERQTYIPRANAPQSIQAFSWLQMTVSEGLHGGGFSGGTAALRVSNSSEGNFTFGENWDYGHIPLGPSGTRASRISSTGWVLMQASKHKEEAWEVMRYLFRAENIYRFAELSNGLGSRRTVVAKMVTQSNLLTKQHKSTLLEILEYSLPHPSCAVSVTSIENAIRTWYSRLYSGQIDALTMGNSLQFDLQALIQ
jgi:multiple sugar transport system substrate-binding protein